jgi:hypothetical protein
MSLSQCWQEVAPIVDTLITRLRKIKYGSDIFVGFDAVGRDKLVLYGFWKRL